MTSLYDQLNAIVSANPDFLRSFQQDFQETDRQILANSPAGIEFVWILRRQGTQIFQIGAGFDPMSVIYWIREGDVKVFHLRVTDNGGVDGEVEEISYDRATALANTPAPKNARIWAPDQDTLVYMLGDRILGRVAQTTDQSWDAFNGPLQATRTWIGEFASMALAKEAVEDAAIARVAA